MKSYSYRTAFITLLLFMSALHLPGQETTSSTEVYQQYSDLDNVDEKFQYIDSLDKYRKFKIDSLYASILYNTIDKKLLEGDTADILGISVGLMNYYYSPLAEPDSSIRLFKRLENFIDKNNAKDVGGVLLGYGDALYAKTELKKSYDIYKQAGEFYKNEGDSSLPNYGKSYLHAAEVAASLGEYGKATQDFEVAKGIYSYQKDTSMLLWSQYGQSQIFSRLRLLEKAEDTQDKIIEIARKSNSPDILVAVYNAKSTDAIKNKNYQKSLEYARKMVQTSKKYNLGDYFQLHAYLKLTSSFLDNNQIDSAQHYFNIFEKIVQQYQGNKFYTTEYNLVKARLDFANGSPLNALTILDENLNSISDIESNNHKKRFLELKYEIDTSLNQYKEADVHLNRLKSLKDSIHEETLENQFLFYQTLFETASKKRQIASQEAEIVKLDLENRRQRNIWIAIIAALLFLGAIIYFIRDKNFAEKEKRMQEKYSQLLLTAQEEERRRISRELHDGVGQSLILIKNRVKLESTEETQELVKNTLEEIRQVSRGLHPFVLENLGLTASIKKLVDEADHSNDIFFDTDIDNVDNLLTKDKELNVYRIIQEAISNLLKHSEADAAKIIAKKHQKYLNFKVKDFGKGFDLTTQDNIFMSLGMRTMKERAKISEGQLSITSEKNVGTYIELIVPYDES